MLSNYAHIAYHVQTNTNKQKYLAHYLFCNIFCILLDFYRNPIGIPDSYRILVRLGGDCKVLTTSTIESFFLPFLPFLPLSFLSFWLASLSFFILRPALYL